MNPFEMVIGIVLIVTIGRVLSARLGVNPRLSKRDGKRQGRTLLADSDGVSAAEADRMKAEITRLNERLAVLEGEQEITPSLRAALREATHQTAAA